jgi:hypothetical protein
MGRSKKPVSGRQQIADGIAAQVVARARRGALKNCVLKLVEIGGLGCPEITGDQQDDLAEGLIEVLCEVARWCQEAGLTFDLLSYQAEAMTAPPFVAPPAGNLEEMGEQDGRVEEAAI